MVIVMEPAASEEQVQKVIETLVGAGYDVHRSTGVNYTVLGAVGVPRVMVDPRLPGVDPRRARGGQDLGPLTSSWAAPSRRRTPS